jgi:hypothetical protein
LSAGHTQADNRTGDSCFSAHAHAADDAPIVRPLDAAYIRWQMRFNPPPLLLAQPKQVPAHDPIPFQ